MMSIIPESPFGDFAALNSASTEERLKMRIPEPVVVGSRGRSVFVPALPTPTPGFNPARFIFAIVCPGNWSA